jgi:hypothetical protein
MGRTARFKQADLTRAYKAAAAAGVKVARVEIAPDGKISLFSADSPQVQEPNEWDEIFTTSEPLQARARVGRPRSDRWLTPEQKSSAAMAHLEAAAAGPKTQTKRGSRLLPKTKEDGE